MALACKVAPPSPCFPLNAVSTGDHRAASFNGNGQPPSQVTSAAPAPPFSPGLYFPLSAAILPCAALSSGSTLVSINSPLAGTCRSTSLSSPPQARPRPALDNYENSRNLHALGSTGSTITTPWIPLYFSHRHTTLPRCFAFAGQHSAFLHASIVQRRWPCLIARTLNILLATVSQLPADLFPPPAFRRQIGFRRLVRCTSRPISKHSVVRAPKLTDRPYRCPVPTGSGQENTDRRPEISRASQS